MYTLGSRRKIRCAGRGGLDDLQALLGLQGSPSDILLVSVDLEAGRGERDRPVSYPDFPVIKECGLAVFDTRKLADRNIPAGQYITTQQFSTSNSSSDFLDCDATDFQECVFCETTYIKPARLANTIKETFQRRDETNPDSFRNVAIIGHSPMSDLRILCRIGVDVTKMSNIVAILDTHCMSQKLVGLDPPLQAFSLASLLESFHLPFRPNELHNAGNDATYTLHLALAFALREDEGGRLSHPDQHLLATRLREVLNGEVATGQKWTPVRQSLGARAPM